MLASPEIELLISCASLKIEPREREKARQLVSLAIDWDYLYRLADRHGLLGLLFLNLDVVARDAVPTKTLSRLWAVYEMTCRRNQIMATELLRILNLLSTNGVEAIPFKGPVLAQSIYGAVGLRTFGDLDILLDRKDVLRARTILAKDGYISVARLNPDIETQFVNADKQYDLELVHARSGLLVEIHWKTNPEFVVERTNDPAWWGALAAVRLQDVAVRSLPPTELLLVLCLHGAKHYWQRLNWLVDVAELIRQNPLMDWMWIMDVGDRLGCKKRLAVGLYLARSILNAPLPNEVWKSVARKPSVVSLANALMATLFQADAPVMNIFRRFRLDQGFYDHPSQRIRHLGAWIFAPGVADWEERTASSRIGATYLHQRFSRLAKKYGRMLLARRS